MYDVYTFIEQGLSSFSDGGVYDNKIREHCLNLNKYLNKVSDQNYDDHLNLHISDIDKEIEIISTLINDILYVDLSKNGKCLGSCVKNDPHSPPNPRLIPPQQVDIFPKTR